MSALIDDDPFAMTAQKEAPRPPRKPLIGTPQQEDFWSQLVAGDGHTVLEARAGTGKSASCREAMWRLIEDGGNPSIRYCCFNKAIADEFRRDCPPGVQVGTMHSFGLTALRKALGQGDVVAEKSYQLLDATPGGKDLKGYHRRAVVKLVSLAKNHALRPDADPNEILFDLFDLVTRYDISCFGREEPIVVLAREVLRASALFTGRFDYDDMLWLPVVLGINCPTVDHLFVDEAQDLNPVQHELAAILNREGRTTIVGDPFQAIYAFRGADSQSIGTLRDQLDAITLPLTITWRCPRSHVELAQDLVPDLVAAPSAIEGEIHETHDLDAELRFAQPGDLILCRANAPLVSACLKLIGQRRKATMRGRAFGDSLTAVLRKLEADTIAELITMLRVWEAGEIDRLERRDGTEHLVEATRDKAGALRAIAETCGSPAEVPGVITSLFDDGPASDRITLSSIHRAKGSEARHVRLMDLPFPMDRPGKITPQWELDQRRNLEYVSKTRSKQTLVLIQP